MLRTMFFMMALSLAAGPVACSGSDGDDNQNNQNNQSSHDAAVTPDSSTEPDAGGNGDQGIGSACECTDEGCDQLEVPLPGGGTGTITGCDVVPTDWTGGDRVCLRSYKGTLANHTWFARGYCGIMATSCTGSSMICGSAVFGDYDAMTSCPAGTVMIQDSQEVSYGGSLNATVQNKLCAKACTAEGQCRETETDPVWDNEATQYQCLDKGGVKFCYDPRNLSESYTATAY